MRFLGRIKNFWLVLKDQLPASRLWRNFWSGRLKGLFHERSHLNARGQPKIAYGSKASAIKAATKMAEKKGVHFSNYKCIHCDGYHIGKNAN